MSTFRRPAGGKLCSALLTTQDVCGAHLRIRVRFHSCWRHSPLSSLKVKKRTFCRRVFNSRADDGKDFDLFLQTFADPACPFEKLFVGLKSFVRRFFYKKTEVFPPTYEEKSGDPLENIPDSKIVELVKRFVLFECFLTGVQSHTSDQQRTKGNAGFHRTPSSFHLQHISACESCASLFRVVNCVFAGAT